MIRDAEINKITPKRSAEKEIEREERENEILHAFCTIATAPPNFTKVGICEFLQILRAFFPLPEDSIQRAAGNGNRWR